MKYIMIIILVLGSLNFLVAQNCQEDMLKEFDYYVEKDVTGYKYRTKIYLENGLPKTKKVYLKSKLSNTTEFKYDSHKNLVRKIETYNRNEGKINDTTNIKLTYNDSSLLIQKETYFGIIESYSDFTKLGKPKLIERTQKFDISPYQEIFEYDKNGNVIKAITYTRDLIDKTIVEKATTYFKYDNWCNVIEIHREYIPKKEFPIHIYGRPPLYEHTYFRYEYNKNGLWTKKHKTVVGEEKLIAKRKYK